jgi:hypothetical protein
MGSWGVGALLVTGAGACGFAVQAAIATTAAMAQKRMQEWYETDNEADIEEGIGKSFDTRI